MDDEFEVDEDIIGIQRQPRFFFLRTKELRGTIRQKYKTKLVSWKNNRYMHGGWLLGFRRHFDVYSDSTVFDCVVYFLAGWYSIINHFIFI